MQRKNARINIYIHNSDSLFLFICLLCVGFISFEFLSFLNHPISFIALTFRALSNLLHWYIHGLIMNIIHFSAIGFQFWGNIIISLFLFSWFELFIWKHWFMFLIWWWCSCILYWKPWILWLSSFLLFFPQT